AQVRPVCVPVAVPTNVHHHTVRYCADCLVAISRRNGSARVLLARCFVAPDRVLAKQVATLLVTPFRSPVQDMTKPFAVGMHSPRADRFALPFRYRRPISSYRATATQLDERLPLTEGDQMRVLACP